MRKNVLPVIIEALIGKRNRKLKKKKRAYYGHTKVKRKMVMVAVAKAEGDIYISKVILTYPSPSVCWPGQCIHPGSHGEESINV